MGKRDQIIYIFFVVVVTTGNISFIRFEDLVFSTNPPATELAKSQESVFSFFIAVASAETIVFEQ